MPPVIPHPKSIRSFPSAAEFDRWLRLNHATTSEIWLKIHKKNSRLPTVTYAEALDSALCYGWIDGLKKPFDDKSWLQRFTPRTKTSIWSQVNTEHVARLLDAGRMRPAGQKQIDLAKSDGRWDRAYARGRDMQIPGDLQKAVDANPKAQATFEILNRLNRFAMAFRVGNAKKPEVRAERIAFYVAMLARGETLTDNGKKNPTKVFSAKGAEKRKLIAVALDKHSTSRSLQKQVAKKGTEATAATKAGATTKATTKQSRTTKPATGKAATTSTSTAKKSTKKKTTTRESAMQKPSAPKSGPATNTIAKRKPH